MKLADILKTMSIGGSVAKIDLRILTDELDEVAGANSNKELNELINEYGNIEVVRHSIYECATTAYRISYDCARDIHPSYIPVDIKTITIRVTD